MRTSQLGDRIRVHYVMRFEDGTARSSRVRGGRPVEVTVGTAHRQLPGLAEELVGVGEGQTVTVSVPPGRAFGMPDPDRVCRVARARFPADERLTAGRRAWMRMTRGRTRRVRVMEVLGDVVVVDANHARAGQALVLEVEVVSILALAPDATHWGP